MRFNQLSLLIIVGVLSSPVVAKNKVVYYEPKLVDLNGSIITLKYPGPPNYESIKNGDAEEIGAYLILKKPIDVKTLSNVEIGNDEYEKNIKLIQLIVLNHAYWSKLKEGNYVNLTGTLSHALTGHHHARILITIEKIEVLSNHKMVDNKLNLTDEDREFQKYQHLQN
jgi:hypothetical protein